MVSMSRLNKALSIILILGLLATITAIIYLVVTSPAGERFTEFYIKGLKGKAGGYAGAIKAGEAQVSSSSLGRRKLHWTDSSK